MTSAINYLSINENFPVAGQDNDTQVFRDNFDTIKTSLRLAKEEITDLQSAGARIDNDNNFDLNIIENAVVQRIREQKFPANGPAPYVQDAGVDWLNASYFTYIIDGSITSLSLENLPGDANYATESTPIGVGKMTLELRSDGTTRTFNFITSGGTVLRTNGFPLSKVGDSQQPLQVPADATTPVIVEVWRHRSDEIFMRYVGVFA